MNQTLNIYRMMLILLLLLPLYGCFAAPERREDGQDPASVELMISAASSLMGVLEEVKSVFELNKDRTVKVIVNYASSGTLQKQIEQGAPVDIFLSASNEQMGRLVDTGLVEQDGVVHLLSNEIVLIVPVNTTVSVKGFEELRKEEITRIAIGIPETVPAGTYAKETLISLGIWDQVQDKLVLAKDVRQVLTYVETGNVGAGIVYHSDAIAARNVKAVAQAEPHEHSPIIYPAAVITNSKHRKEAEEFLDFLRSEEASTIFLKYGFKVTAQRM